MCGDGCRQGAANSDGNYPRRLALLLRGNRIVIPHSLRQVILQRIHEGQLGIEKCKRRARDTVYWPGINKDIENMIGKCETCKKFQSRFLETVISDNGPCYYCKEWQNFAREYGFKHVTQVLNIHRQMARLKKECITSSSFWRRLQTVNQILI